MNTLNQEKVKECASYWDKESIKAHQVAVFVMCGGGFLGKMAAEQPADFYIDDRVSGLPFSKKKIYQAVETLTTLAKENKLNPHDMPQMSRFHNCGIF